MPVALPIMITLRVFSVSSCCASVSRPLLSCANSTLTTGIGVAGVTTAISGGSTLGIDTSGPPLSIAGGGCAACGVIAITCGSGGCVGGTVGVITGTPTDSSGVSLVPPAPFGGLEFSCGGVHVGGGGTS